MPGRRALEVKAEIIDCLLGGVGGVVGPLGGRPTDHAEVLGEGGGGSSLIGEEVVDDCTTVEAGEAAVRPLEVKERRPVIGLVLLDRRGGALALLQLLRGGGDPKIASTKDNGCGRTPYQG
jgi:hypothetical protein